MDPSVSSWPGSREPMSLAGTRQPRRATARQRERRQSPTDVCLDGERVAADPDHRDTDDLPVHDRATLAPATDTSSSEGILEDLDVDGGTSERHARDVEADVAMSYIGRGE